MVWRVLVMLWRVTDTAAPGSDNAVSMTGCRLLPPCPRRVRMAWLGRVGHDLAVQSRAGARAAAAAATWHTTAADSKPGLWGARREVYGECGRRVRQEMDESKGHARLQHIYGEFSVTSTASRASRNRASPNRPRRPGGPLVAHGYSEVLNPDGLHYGLHILLKHTVVSDEGD